jgi:hypothetical protein
MGFDAIEFRQWETPIQLAKPVFAHIDGRHGVGALRGIPDENIGLAPLRRDKRIWPRFILPVKFRSSHGMRPPCQR